MAFSLRRPDDPGDYRSPGHRVNDEARQLFISSIAGPSAHSPRRRTSFDRQSRTALFLSHCSQHLAHPWNFPKRKYVFHCS
jgi:hypothetical protein